MTLSGSTKRKMKSIKEYLYETLNEFMLEPKMPDELYEETANYVYDAFAAEYDLDDGILPFGDGMESNAYITKDGKVIIKVTKNQNTFNGWKTVKDIYYNDQPSHLAQIYELGALSDLIYVEHEEEDMFWCIMEVADELTDEEHDMCLYAKYALEDALFYNPEFKANRIEDYLKQNNYSDEAIDKIYRHCISDEFISDLQIDYDKKISKTYFGYYLYQYLSVMQELGPYGFATDLHEQNLGKRKETNELVFFDFS